MQRTEMWTETGCGWQLGASGTKVNIHCDVVQEISGNAPSVPATPGTTSNYARAFGAF